MPSPPRLALTAGVRASNPLSPEGPARWDLARGLPIPLPGLCNRLQTPAERCGNLGGVGPRAQPKAFLGLSRREAVNRPKDKHVKSLGRAGLAYKVIRP